MNNRKIISRLSFVAGFCILAMFLVTVFTGRSQEEFEITQSVANYTNGLISAEMPLRIIFTIDFIFISVFITVFVYLTQYLKTKDRITNAVADVCLLAMLITGILDFHEDLHILTMLHNAINNLPIEQSEISLQMTLSALKFSASYVSLFLLGFLLPAGTFTEKLLKYSLWFFQLPIGALVYTAPENLHFTFAILRFVFMISGFFLLAYNFSNTYEEQKL